MLKTVCLNTSVLACIRGSSSCQRVRTSWNDRIILRIMSLSRKDTKKIQKVLLSWTRVFGGSATIHSRVWQRSALVFCNCVALSRSSGFQQNEKLMQNKKARTISILAGGFPVQVHSGIRFYGANVHVGWQMQYLSILYHKFGPKCGHQSVTSHEKTKVSIQQIELKTDISSLLVARVCRVPDSGGRTRIANAWRDGCMARRNGTHEIDSISHDLGLI
jgi:hypothetical protein